MVKQLKNRYNDPALYKRFLIGVDRAKMRLYDLEESAQKDIADSGSREDDTPLYDRIQKNKVSKDFSGFKL